MNLRNTIQFKKQDKNNHINFFEVKKPFSVKDILFETYLEWLFKSTLDLKSKLKLIEISKMDSQIKKAIQILQNNYSCSKIKSRNQELKQYIQQRMDSS